ncbi:MAG: tRNA (adenosine(37)-N6)-threonylcarbamoyltransferase complex dimerization subunit type 1 TsaB [Candidatus Omnitrophota bacterium]
MLKIIGIDTSSKFLSIGLSEDSSMITEEHKLLDRSHSRFLIPYIEDMLKKQDISIDEIDCFFIGLGPGSFTGLRIGVSTVKGLGMGSHKTCMGVPSIDAIAMNVGNEGDTIVPVIDAKRSLVYTSVYTMKKNIRKNETGHLLVNIDTLMEKVSEGSIFLGDGLTLYKDDIKKKCKRAVFMEEKYWYPKASNIIKLGLEKLKTSKNNDLSELDPIYLYAKDCQVKRSHDLRSKAT